MKNRNYALRYAMAQEFHGYETPASLLTAMANFDNEHNNQTIAVTIHWNADAMHGGTLTWEDYK